MTNGLNHIVSITELRRNFGEITASLATIDYMILTRGGEPFALLKATPNEKRKIMKLAAGAWKDTPMDNDRLWQEVFKRRSRREEIKL